MKVIKATTYGGKDHATRSHRLILIERVDGYEPFITALQCEGDRDWIWGHYHKNLRSALTDFDERRSRMIHPTQIAIDLVAEDL